MKKIVLYIITLTAIVSWSCSSDDNLPPVNEEQLVLFQFEYINHAWGYQHNGWLIDNEGNVKEYNLPDDWRWNHDSEFISKDSLEFNYYQTTATIKQIEQNELNNQKALILATLNGSITEMVCPMADAGAFALYCYYWDESTNLYQRQLLNLTGDCQQHNTTQAAEILTEWLTNL